jgi:hypothetical protein
MKGWLATYDDICFLLLEIIPMRYKNHFAFVNIQYSTVQAMFLITGRTQYYFISFIISVRNLSFIAFKDATLLGVTVILILEKELLIRNLGEHSCFSYLRVFSKKL